MAPVFASPTVVVAVAAAAAAFLPPMLAPPAVERITTTKEVVFRHFLNKLPRKFIDSFLFLFTTLVGKR